MKWTLTRRYFLRALEGEGMCGVNAPDAPKPTPWCIVLPDTSPDS